jgi:hypothetical protein
MSAAQQNTPAHADLSRDELMSALFATMVVQQTNMALVFLGKLPHPESGQSVQDMDAARMFIDQLEMLECKTRGNLDKDEDALLKQSLMNLRMAFVEAVGKATAPLSEKGPPAAESAAASPAQETSGDATQPIISGEPSGEESRKRFTKKY